MSTKLVNIPVLTTEKVPVFRRAFAKLRKVTINLPGFLEPS